jgi:tRNA A-37 threonylcarbamoyl transferase component Bud32
MGTFVHIEPEFEALLRNNGLVRFADFMNAAGDGPPVSHHWNRETITLDLRDGDAPRRFFLKRLTRPQPEHVAAALFMFRRPLTQPEKEWRHIERLESLGVSCMRRAAMGVERGAMGLPRAAFLLGEAVPASWTVADWMEAWMGERANASPGERGATRDSGGHVPPYLAAVPAWMRRRLAVELGMLARTLDAAGIAWRDISADHIFAEPADEGRRGARWRFWLVDVERLDPRAPSPDGVASAAEMADLLDPTTLDGARSPGWWDAWVFAGARRRAPRTAQGESSASREFLCEIARSRHLARRMPRFHRRGRPVLHDPVIRDGLRMDRRCADLLAANGMGSLAALMHYEADAALDKPGLPAWRKRERVMLKQSPVKWGGGADRPAGDRGPNAAFTAYVKRYVDPPAAARCRGPDRRRSLAGAELHGIRRLAKAGIPTPFVMCFGEDGVGPDERASAIMLAEVPGRSLERWVEHWAANPSATPPPAARRALIERLAAMTRRMHDAGLFHRDYYLAHVFADFERRPPGLCLIDLARVVRYRRNRFRWRVKDLSALEYSSPPGMVTRADRMRFLYAYLRATTRRETVPGNRRVIRVDGRGAAGGRIERMCAALPSGRDTLPWAEAIVRRIARMTAHDRRHGRRGHRLGPEAAS